MAEADKGRWNRAKRENKRYVLRLLNSNMHVIVCLRAREKSKIIPKNESSSGKEEVISLGIQPIAERGFVYEMMCSWMVEEKTHLATPLKLPEQFHALFPDPRLITKQDGERIRLWNEGAIDFDPVEKLKRRSRAAADEGMDAYTEFFKALSAGEKKALIDSIHDENKRVAIQVDTAAVMARFNELSDSFGFRAALGACGYETVEEIPADKRAAILAELERELAPVTNPV